MNLVVYTFVSEPNFNIWVGLLTRPSLTSINSKGKVTKTDRITYRNMCLVLISMLPTL